ncbi:MAG: dihydroorotate dehydrogenase [Actinobacteria bacterium]|nr:dihydroorotate dehydrogenase [Actinomycetota bacterium]
MDSSTSAAVRVGSLTLNAPVMTASGTAGHGVELAPYLDLGELGAVVVKSLAAFEWQGNPGPRLHAAGAGMLNSVGLQGPGVEHWLAHDLPALIDAGATVVASIWGRSVDEYRRAAQLLAVAPAQVVAVEVNLSCPNLHGQEVFAHDPSLSAAVITAAAVCGRPCWAKLSPNTDKVIEVASAVAAAGAEAVTLVNTLRGMVLDRHSGLPVPSAAGGGYSGQPLHAVAVRTVFDVHAALPHLPIVGVGGVNNAWDAAELMLAGASAVQVGTASFVNPRAAGDIQRSLLAWCANRGLTVAELTGLAHRSGLPAGLPGDCRPGVDGGR